MAQTDSQKEAVKGIRPTRRKSTPRTEVQKKEYKRQVENYPFLEDDPKTTDIIEGAEGMHMHYNPYGSQDLLLGGNKRVSEESAQSARNNTKRHMGIGDKNLPVDKKRKRVKGL